MGKASKKKAQRRAGIGESRDDLVLRRQLVHLVAALEQMSDMAAAERARQSEAARAWAGGSAPAIASIPEWPDGSVGHRFFTSRSVGDAAEAPSLREAVPPDAGTLAADPGHMAVAGHALVRAVVLDDLAIGDPAVAAVADALLPAVQSEREYWSDETQMSEFPELSGPLFLIGGRALFDATLAVVGDDDPLEPVLGVLTTRLDAVLKPLGLGAGVTGTVVGAALICALTKDYAFEKPGDAELLTRLNAEEAAGNALEGLLRDKVIGPEDAIRVGLAVLAGLADLCRTQSASILVGAE